MDALHRFKNDLQNQNFSTEFGIGKKVALCRFRNFERKKEAKKIAIFLSFIVQLQTVICIFPYLTKLPFKSIGVVTHVTVDMNSKAPSSSKIFTPNIIFH